MTDLPIPAPRADDEEDVHWALSTAAAVWARGESQEALKWLRRAAESASDANRDARSLELFKAAAEFTGRLQDAAAGQQQAAPGPKQLESAATTSPLNARGGTPPIAVRGTPPPPPRGRAASGHHAGSSGPHSVVEPMANTVPGSQLPGPPLGVAVAPLQPSRGHAPAAADVRSEKPFGSNAPTRMSAGRGVSPSQAGKTLASNYTYDQAQEAAAALRRGAAKTVQPEAAGRAAREAEAQRIRSSSHGGRAAVPPASPAPAAEPPASSGRTPSKRRTTQTGRRGSSSSLNRVEVAAAAVVPPKDVAIREAHEPRPAQPAAEPQPATVPEPIKTARFEDEGTIEREMTLVGVSFPDLDEQTNVLTGKEASLELFGDTTPSDVDVGLDDMVRRDDATDPGDSLDDSETRRTALPRGLLSAFRVAVISRDHGARVELRALVPGEPTPAGAVGAMLVATDLPSSVALADLLGKRVRGGTP